MISLRSFTGVVISQHSDFDGWVGLRKLDVRILVREIIRTPRNPVIIVRCTDFLGRECSDLRVGGSAEIRTLFGFVNLYELLDDPLSSLCDSRKCSHQPNIGKNNSNYNNSLWNKQ